MGNINVNQSAYKGLQKLDQGKDGKIDLKDLRAAADTNNDGKVGLQEAANLEEQLGRYVDSNTATQLAEAAIGNKPVQLSYTLIQPPAPSERIDGKLGNLRLDSPLKMMNTPPDPPMVVRTAYEGGNVHVRLDPGVELSKWPPSTVAFTDPETGKEATGFKVEFSTGDVLIVPMGQSINLSKEDPPPANGLRIGGRTEFYRIDENGETSNDLMIAKYATVFCTRGV